MASIVASASAMTASEKSPAVSYTAWFTTGSGYGGPGGALPCGAGGRQPRDDREQDRDDGEEPSHASEPSVPRRRASVTVPSGSTTTSAGRGRPLYADRIDAA